MSKKKLWFKQQQQQPTEDKENEKREQTKMEKGGEEAGKQERGRELGVGKEEGEERKGSKTTGMQCSYNSLQWSNDLKATYYDHSSSVLNCS